MPKDYELVLGQISIESQNMVKINLYEPVFFYVTQETFIQLVFSTTLRTVQNRLAQIGHAPYLDIHESSRELA